MLCLSLSLSPRAILASTPPGVPARALGEWLMRRSVNNVSLDRVRRNGAS
jgi:hypothetical protein